MLGKVFLYIIAIVALLGSILLRYSDNPLEEKYDESRYVNGRYNKKHVANFGIRRFGIFRSVKYSNKDLTRWVLSDLQANALNSAIEEDVYSYIDLNSYVYTVGDEGYTKLNYETAEVTQSKEVSAFSEEDQAIFNNLVEGKIGTKNAKGEKWGGQNG